VIVCDDDVLREQIKREMRINPLGSADDANKAAARIRQKMNGRVCAVVPNYNYARFVTAALDSLVNQTRKPDEIIVVDDASTDNSAAVITKWIEENSTANARLIVHSKNSGTVGAPRNTGIKATNAEFIVALDSDDMLEPEYIETLHEAIKDKPNVGVVYSGVQTHLHTNEHGDAMRIVHTDWPIAFDWEWMSAPVNPPNTCIPTASMFRREMWYRAGGYDNNRQSAEDAEFWLRGLGLGFEALKATDKPLFVYRKHGESMSSRKVLSLQTWSPLHRGVIPLAAPIDRAPTFRDYTKPGVSVIIPVGPEHAQHVHTAISSVIAQTYDNWEIVVVNDSGKSLSHLLDVCPFVRVLDTKSPSSGVSSARNAGLRASRAPLAFFLDADDYILPKTLELMIKRYANGDAGYVYPGWWFVNEDGKHTENIAGEWHSDAWLSYESRGLHGVSVLISVEDALRIGGFDEHVGLFEDWEFFARCTIAGLCGARVGDALLAYRLNTGNRRKSAMSGRDATVQYLREHHGDYIEGVKEIMGCCGGNKSAANSAARDVAAFGGVTRIMPIIENDGTVLMRFTGSYAAPVTYNGNAGRQYQGCATCDPVSVHPDDVERLENTGVWVLVRDTLPPAPSVVSVEALVDQQFVN
jgi:glycosyltransferase involved in cell wall biosynthesis